MIDKKVLFKAPKRGYLNNGYYKGTVLDKVKVEKISTDNTRRSDDPFFKSISVVDAYLVLDLEEGNFHVVLPINIVNILKEEL